MVERTGTIKDVPVPVIDIHFFLCEICAARFDESEPCALE